MPPASMSPLPHPAPSPTAVAPPPLPASAVSEVATAAKDAAAAAAADDWATNTSTNAAVTEADSDAIAVADASASAATVADAPLTENAAADTAAAAAAAAAESPAASDAADDDVTTTATAIVDAPAVDVCPTVSAPLVSSPGAGPSPASQAAACTELRRLADEMRGLLLLASGRPARPGRRSALTIPELQRRFLAVLPRLPPPLRGPALTPPPSDEDGSPSPPATPPRLGVA
jgi:hypothetical protein